MGSVPTNSHCPPGDNARMSGSTCFVSPVSRCPGCPHRLFPLPNHHARFDGRSYASPSGRRAKAPRSRSPRPCRTCSDACCHLSRRALRPCHAPGPRGNVETILEYRPMARGSMLRTALLSLGYVVAFAAVVVGTLVIVFDMRVELAGSATRLIVSFGDENDHYADLEQHRLQHDARLLPAVARSAAHAAAGRAGADDREARGVIHCRFRDRRDRSRRADPRRVLDQFPWPEP